jgi:hypothetical protein
MRLLLTISLLLCRLIGYSQDVQLLSNFNNESFRFTTILEKEINNKWDYFSITEVEAAYKDTNKLSFESNHFVNYKLENNFTLTTGIGLQNDNVLPQIGLGYSNEKNSWTYAFYPTFNYGIADKQFGTSLNGIIEFTPAINAKWNFYNLLLLDFDYDLRDALQSQQYLNVGFLYNRNLNFGVNVDLMQSDNYRENDVVLGLFLGFDL